MGECVRILVVEERPLARGGLRHLLEGEAGFEVVGVVGRLAEGARLATEAPPDVILLGMGSATEPPWAGLRHLHAVAPAVPILLMGEATTPTPLLLLAGARGLLRATADADELFEALRTVVRGHYWFGPEAFDEVVQHLRRNAANAANGARDADGLTLRERQVVVGVARGESNREIAARLGIAEATVKQRLTAVFGRFGLANRAELSAWATHRKVEEDTAQSGHERGSTG